MTKDAFKQCKKEFLKEQPKIRHTSMIGFLLNDIFSYLSNEQVNHLMQIKYDKNIINFCQDGEKCLLCQKKKRDNFHEISCCKNNIHLVTRHNMIVHALLAKLNKDKRAQPVSKDNGNKREHGKLPDIEFVNERGETWIIDV